MDWMIMLRKEARGSCCGGYSPLTSFLQNTLFLPRFRRVVLIAGTRETSRFFRGSIYLINRLGSGLSGGGQKKNGTEQLAARVAARLLLMGRSWVGRGMRDVYPQHTHPFCTRELVMSSRMCSEVQQHCDGAGFGNAKGLISKCERTM